MYLNIYICVAPMGMWGSQLGIAARGDWNLIAIAKMHGLDLLEDGATREKSSSFLLCSLEGLKSSPKMVGRAWKLS